MTVWLGLLSLVAVPILGAMPVQAQLVTSPAVLLRSLSFVGSRGWAVGYETDPQTGVSQGVALVTADGGTAWRAESLPGASVLSGVDFANASDGWAVGYRQDASNGTSQAAVLATVDGGANWAAEALPQGGGVHLRAVDFVSASDGWAVGYRTDSQSGVPSAVVYATTDGGVSWREQAVPGASVLSAVDFANASDGWAVGYALNEAEGTTRALVLTTTDAGASWAPQSLPQDSGTHLRAVDFASPGRGWLAGYQTNAQSGVSQAVVYATSDGGGSWQRVPVAQATQLDALGFDGSTLFAAGDALDLSSGVSQGLILASADGGATWRTAEAAPQAGFYALAAAPGRVVAAGYSRDMQQGVSYALLEASTDGGGAWTAGEFSTQGLAAAAVAEGPFPDVAPDYWAAPAIAALKDAGIVAGESDGLFHPHSPVTRAEFVAMLARAEGLAASGGPTPFRDVPGDAWYAPFVAAAYAAGWAHGTAPDQFSPQAEVTRQEAGLWVASSLRLPAAPKGTLASFQDVAAVAAWARAGVAAAVAAHFMAGLPGGYLDPNAPLTRAQAAALVYRVLSTR